MDYRPLGRSGLRIAPLVFGANVFGWSVDQAGASRLLDRFVDAGLNAIDTADVYSRWVPGNQGGESETMIGNWLKASPSRRAQVRESGAKAGRRRGRDAPRRCARTSPASPTTRDRSAGCSRARVRSPAIPRRTSRCSSPRATW